MLKLDPIEAENLAFPPPNNISSEEAYSLSVLLLSDSPLVALPFTLVRFFFDLASGSTAAEPWLLFLERPVVALVVLGVFIIF